MVDIKTLGNYKGKVNDAKTFDKPNKDKVRLSSDEEYVFELVKTHIKEGVPNFKGQKVDKVFCIFSDVIHKNEVLVGFRIDNLTWNTEKPDFQSPLITFFEMLKCPIEKPVNGEFPDLSMYLIPGIKFRARVTPLMKDGEFTFSYKLELKTVRKDVPATSTPQTDIPTLTPEVALKQALLLCKGAKTQTEAIQCLVNPMHIAAFISLDRAGKIVYPIKGE